MPKIYIIGYLLFFLSYSLSYNMLFNYEFDPYFCFKSLILTHCFNNTICIDFNINCYTF